MGVIDEEYVRKANDPRSIVGRKIQVSHAEVTSTIGIIKTLRQRLYAGILHPAS
jgi:hypothetical protein